MIRFAIFTAVSTEQQVQEASLGEQEAKCRAAGTSRGWQETAGPFIIAGQSRTRWTSLSDAERELPELKAALDAAQSGQYDVLVTYDFTRLRDLLDQVSKTLSHYGVQLYSVSQPSEIINPGEFTPYTDDSNVLLRSVFQAVSRTEISALRRRYRLGMPARLTSKGLQPAGVPFGYRKPPGQEWNPKAVVEPDPVESVWMLKIKDLFLSGGSSTSIAQFLNDNKVPTPRNKPHWSPSTILHILHNPFYAGVVRWGFRKYSSDPRTGKDKIKLSGNAITAKGAHVPLWDMDTHQAIQTELERRRENNAYKGPKHTFALSNLLYCGKCGRRMGHDTNGPRVLNGERQSVFRCLASTRTTHKEHVSISVDKANALVAAELMRLFHDGGEEVQETKTDERARIESALTELETRRARIEAAYEAGEYNLAKFSERAASLDKQSEIIGAQLAELERIQAGRQRALEAAANLSGLEDLPTWLMYGDPAAVNRTLHLIIEKVIVFDDKVELKMK